MKIYINEINKKNCIIFTFIYMKDMKNLIQQDDNKRFKLHFKIQIYKIKQG